MSKGIPPEKFYGRKNAAQEKIEAILKKRPKIEETKPSIFKSLLHGPSTTWKVFKKQQDAIDCCLQRRNGLMCFAFEDINSRRMFLVAHPKVFWSFNSHRFFKSCSTYEIIREYSACKLYLDIEYELEHNISQDGDRMLDNFLKIINYNLQEIFRVICSRDDILDLDSSSSTKFSRHIIYQIKNVAFQDNYSVGNFVKKICIELKEAYDNSLMGENEKLKQICVKYGLGENDILELFVSDKKNKRKLFVDDGVYTKNRHFRLLGSSKSSKNIPLVISSKNKYKPERSKESEDCSVFLDSLITYFSGAVDRVLEFEEPGRMKRNGTGHSIVNREKRKESSESGLYPEIDSFINGLISPNGRIRKKVFFSDSSTILYDIQGFRYCDNIKREHKSNNIKYIVDLGSLAFYQKCYDSDCADFRSQPKPLPCEIRFLFEDDSLFENDSMSDFSQFSDEFLLKAVEDAEKENSFELDKTITDDDLGKVVDWTEAVLDVEW